MTKEVIKLVQDYGRNPYGGPVTTPTDLVTGVGKKEYEKSKTRTGASNIGSQISNQAGNKAVQTEYDIGQKKFNDALSSLFGDTSTPAVGGGGGGTSSYTNQIEQAKQQNLNLVNQQFKDQLADLAASEKAAQNRAGRARTQVTTDKEAGIERVSNQADVSRRQARDTASDLQLEARRRARALGAGQSSGYLEVTGDLDQQLLQNLTDINAQQTDLTSTIENTALKALDDLELNLNDQLAAIASDRRLSRRQKDQAVAQIEQNAAEKVLSVQKWASSRASSDNTANILAGFTNLVQRAQAGEFGQNFDVSQIVNAATPALIQSGVIGMGSGQATPSEFGQFIGLPQQPGLDERKFLFDQYQYANDNNVLPEDVAGFTPIF